MLLEILGVFHTFLAHCIVSVAAGCYYGRFVFVVVDVVAVVLVVI